MKTLVVLSLFAALASPAIGEVTSSREPGKPHCKLMDAKEKLIRENLAKASVGAVPSAGKAD
jgi:hypothetical protein